MRIFLCIGSCLLLAAFAARSAPRATDDMDVAAQALIASLDETQQGRTLFAFDDEARFDWHFIPRERSGLPLGAMNEEQRAALDVLLAIALSDEGVERVRGVLELEALLFELESLPDRPALHRDPSNYAFSIFGAPGGGDPWAWKLEGHHLSLNFTVGADGVTFSTPFAIGAHPARVQGGERDGFELLGTHARLARDLVRSFDEEQRTRAIRAEEAPEEVFFGPEKDPLPMFRPGGLRAGLMTEDQRELLRRLIHATTDDLADPERLVSSLEGAAFDGVHFVWMGEVESERFYYRVQGGDFLFEFDVVEAGHVHAVWREREGDFGRGAFGGSQRGGGRR